MELVFGRTLIERIFFSCSFTVVPQDSSICQLRIDFTAFTLSQPDTNGNCIVDNMQVTGGGTRFPTMCGDNNGQHIYIPFSGTSPITVSISTTAAMSFPRVWNLQLSQISCTSAYQAPAGCLQYFTGTTGDVYSFNYGVAANPAMNAMGLPGTRQLALSNYGICIQNAATYCSITYSLVGILNEKQHFISTNIQPSQPLAGHGTVRVHIDE